MFFKSLFLLFYSVPIAIGKTALSGEDMYMSAMRGRGVNVIHIYKDNLWSLGDQSIMPPFIAKPVKHVEIQNETVEAASDVDNNNNSDNKDTEEKVLTESGEENLHTDMEGLKIESETSDENATASNFEQENKEFEMNDELLKTVFLAAIKFKSKDVKLPLIVSTFTKILQDCW